MEKTYPKSLTRKGGFHDEPLEITIPDDSSSFTKHSRLWYRLNDMIESGTVPSGWKEGNLSNLDANGIETVCELYKRI